MTKHICDWDEGEEMCEECMKSGRDEFIRKLLEDDELNEMLKIKDMRLLMNVIDRIKEEKLL